MPIEKSEEMWGTSLRRFKTLSASRISSCAHLNLKGPPQPTSADQSSAVIISQSCFFFLTMTFFLSTAVRPPTKPSTHLSSVLIR